MDLAPTYGLKKIYLSIYGLYPSNVKFYFPVPVYYSKEFS
jgi:hypothetical protein